MIKFFLVFLFFLSSLYGENLLVTSKQNIYDNFELTYLNDENSTKTIEKIAQERFSKTTSNKFALGYQKGTVWFKFTLENTAKNKEFILSLNEHFYEKANLYYYHNNKWIQKSNGLFFPIENRKIKNSKLSFALDIPTQTTQTYYLEIEGKYGYFGNISLYEKEFFYFDKRIDINSLYLLLFGILIIIVVFNTFMYLKLKEKIYLYYVGYSFSNLIFLVNISGILVYFDLQYYIYDLQLSAAFMVGFLILFSLEYLEVKRYIHFMDKFLKIVAFIFFFIGFLVVYSYQPWNKVINNLSGLVTIILIILAAVVYFKGHKKTKYYLFAILAFFVFVVLFTFMVKGVFEYDFLTRYGFVVATVVEATIFSLILTNRYHNLKETNQAYLKTEIKKQTKDLTVLNHKLKKLLSERDLLLKELLHRVKNNFHMIIGILWLHQDKLKVQKDKEVFIELSNKIKSMSKINEYLYKSKDISEVNIVKYLTEVTTLSSSLENKRVKFSKDIENISIKFQDAMSLGIIVNELITNSIKHNKHLKSIDINLCFKKEQEILILELKDNGSSFDPQKSAGIGLLLIEEFCGKLKDSQYQFLFENGNIFLLRFKYDEIK